jgi:hypothetical protein
VLIAAYIISGLLEIVGLALVVRDVAGGVRVAKELGPKLESRVHISRHTPPIAPHSRRIVPPPVQTHSLGTR